MVAQLQSGDYFGHIALNRNKPRSATILCNQAARFATLARKDYKPTIANADRRKMKEKVQMLRNFRIFADRGIRDYAIETIFEFMKS